MSTASDDASSQHTETKIPTDIDEIPILWLGNPGHLEGHLDEFSDYLMRAGRFQALIHDRAVLCGTKLAVESTLSVPFVKGVLTDNRDVGTLSESLTPTVVGSGEERG